MDMIYNIPICNGKSTNCYYRLTLLLSFILLLNTTGYGQKNTLKQSIYFESAKFDLTADSKATLNQLCDSLKTYATYKIFIKGNTDNIGDSNYNKQLSEQRVLAAQQYLIAQGINAKVFTTNAFGEDKPIADNTTDAGKQKNRRVDIAIAFTRPVVVQPYLPPISELYDQLRCGTQPFTIDPNRDTVLRCEGGTILTIKKDAFKTSSGPVTIRVKESFLKSDMFAENLSTTSDKQLIETRGMLYTEATDSRGRNIDLANKKGLIVMIPTDKEKRGEKIFRGKRAPHDNSMNWTVNNNSILTNFSLRDLNICSNYLCGGGKCRFFFCRIRYAFNDLFNYNSEGGSPLSKDMESKCATLERLYKEYGVTNLGDLINAVNQPLLDSFNVSTLAELKDTLQKLNQRKIELAYLNKSLGYDDYRYYVFNMTKLGWANVDIFRSVAPDQMAKLKVNLKTDVNVDCKLVFKNKGFIIPGYQENNQFVFDKIPKGDTAWIVALKYLEGKPYLSLQQITIGNQTVNVDFQSLTLAELKEELKLLNQ